MRFQSVRSCNLKRKCSILKIPWASNLKGFYLLPAQVSVLELLEQSQLSLLHGIFTVG